ncbi:MAG: phage major capsid protein, partial [Pseudomonadota bacterium]
MGVNFNPARARGLVGGVRADATNTEIFAELKRTVIEFKASVQEQLDNQKAKFDDVVTVDKIEKINTDISALTEQLAKANQALAALEVGGSSTTDAPDLRSGTVAFEKFFRRGERALDTTEAKALISTDSDPDGGYLVPVEMEQGIDQLVKDVSIMRQLATVRSINTDTYRKFVNMGGASSGWVGEKDFGPDRRTETDTPSLAEIVTNVQEMYSMPATTQKALDDGSIVDIAAWLADEVQMEFAEQEARAFINGDGVLQPRGLWTFDMVDNDDWEWGKFGYVPSGAAGGFMANGVDAIDRFIDLVYAMRPQLRGQSSFLMNDVTVKTVRKFKDSEGDHMWREPSQPEGVPTILGKPVFTDDYTPKVQAGAFPVAFGNFARTYHIFDRQGIRVMRDSVTQKGKVLFYTTKRVGAGPQHFQ